MSLPIESSRNPGTSVIPAAAVKPVALRAALLRDEIALEDIAAGAVVIESEPTAPQASRYIHFEPPVDAVNFGSAYARMLGVSGEWFAREVSEGHKSGGRSGGRSAGRGANSEEAFVLPGTAWFALGVLVCGGLLWLWS